MAGGGGGGSRDLDQTPTWAVAAVSAVIILTSFFLEKILHTLGQWFSKKNKKAMYDALEKIKSADNRTKRKSTHGHNTRTYTVRFKLAMYMVVTKSRRITITKRSNVFELMVLGFISLLLTFGQNYIAKICISMDVADTMLPCHFDHGSEVTQSKRMLLWNSTIGSTSTHRSLAVASANTCSSGKTSFVSINGLHQLHIFIFFLAIFHVIYSALTMTLGRLKSVGVIQIRGWKEWEMETQTLNYEFSNDPSRFRLVHETSFVKQHASSWDGHPFLLYFVCFFHQFFRSVRKADYLTLRNGFINVHLASGSRFDFRKYIKRSLEDDYKVVVGISPLLWLSAVIYLLLNVHGWKELFWLSLLPPAILLAVGTHLQAIIAKMAIQIKDRHAVVQGIPLVQLSDDHFWFNRPYLVLSLIHFTLFMNTFQLTYFFWIWYDFGLRSCFHQNFAFVIARVVVGVIVQFMCSYITLPLYALVSQMGSHMKRSIFDEQTNHALKKWHQAVRKRHKKEGGSPHSISTNTTPLTSPSSSPVHLLRGYAPTGYSDNMQTRFYSEREIEIPELIKDTRDFLNTQNESSTTTDLTPSFKNGVVETKPADHRLMIEEEPRNEDFTFMKSSTVSKGKSQDLP